MSDENLSPATATSEDTKHNQQRALLAFLLPMVVYMVIQSAEPTPPSAVVESEAAEFDLDLASDDPLLENSGTDKVWLGIITIPAEYYPVVYTIKVVATLAVVLAFLPVYLQWPFKISLLAVGVGLVGGGLWLFCSYLNPTGHLADWLGPEHWLYSWIAPGERAAYKPVVG